VTRPPEAQIENALLDELVEHEARLLPPNWRVDDVAEDGTVYLIDPDGAIHAIDLTVVLHELSEATA
jgi:hypothetical protein